MYGKAIHRHNYGTVRSESAKVLVATKAAKSHCTDQGLQWGVIVKFLMLPYAMLWAHLDALQLLGDDQHNRQI